MRRSNRLILLIGLFFAVIAFVGVFTLLNQKSSTAPPPAPTTTQIVVAAQDIPQGTVITQAMITTITVDIAKKPAGSYELPNSVIGQIARVDVPADGLITSATFNPSTAAAQVTTLLDSGLRAISVQVDQTTGVGTLIQPGDMVDVVLTMEQADNKNPIVVELPPTKGGVPPVTQRNFQLTNPLLNSTTVKVVVENAKVLGILLPPAPTTANAGTQNAQASPAPNTPSLNGQQEIVILAVSPQDAEIVRFAQLDGNLSLLLRSPKDATASPVPTTGITLRQLVDKYGVLPPKIILTTQP